MNKDILKYLFILALAVVVSILIYFHFEDRKIEVKDAKYISDKEEYKNVKVDDITLIEIIYSNEMETEPITITDKEKIKKIFDSLGDIEIVKETDLRVLDDGFLIRVVVGNKALSYYFEGNILVLDKYYEVSGLSKIKELVKE